MKALQAVCSEFYIFPPGHYMRATRDGQVSFTQWFTPRWLVDASYVPQHRADLAKIHDLLVDAVVKRLMTDVPYGMLLSGGLDSSLVAAIVVKHLSESRNSYQMTRLKTFSVGLKGAPDLVAARRVAEFLGTEHFEFHFTVEDGLDALRDLIWHIESYEQVRAAVPMYLLARKIKAMGIKMVLSGEGADEIFGGYLYFHKAPSPDEFHKECVRKTARLHQARERRGGWWQHNMACDMARDMAHIVSCCPIARGEACAAAAVARRCYVTALTDHIHLHAS